MARFSKIRLLRSYWAMFKSYAEWKLPLVVFLAFLSGSLEAMGLALFLPLLRFQALNQQSQSDFSIISRFFGLLGISNNLYLLLGLMISLFTLRGLFKGLETYVRLMTSSSLKLKIQQETLEALKRMSYQRFVTWSRWNINQMMTGHVNAFSQAFDFFTLAISGFISVFVFALSSIITGWELTVIAVAASVFFGLFFKKLTKQSHDLAHERHQHLCRTNSKIIQAVSSFKYLKATEGFRHFENHLQKDLIASSRLQKELSIKRGLLLGAMLPAVSLVFSGIIIYGTGLRGYDISVVLITVGLLYKSISALMQTIGNWHSFTEKLPEAQGLIDSLSELKLMEEPQGKRPFIKLSQGIKLSNISMNFNQKNVLENINMEIGHNTTVGICGASGVGKSTLIDLILGLVKPSKGQVFLDGIPLNDFDLNSWRRQIGFISQDYPLFEDTILNNLTLWTQNGNHLDFDFERIYESLEGSASSTFIDNLPLKLETPIGEKGVALSFGEKQRLAIARELYRKTPLLIFDEATSALDSETENNIEDSIRGLNGKRTILIISHQLNLLAHCDRIFVLEKGRLIEQGTFNDLMNNPLSTFFKLYNLRAERKTG